MKRKFYSELDESADFALNIISTLQVNQPPGLTPIAVPAEKLYNLADKFINLYYQNNKKNRSTFVDTSTYLH